MNLAFKSRRLVMAGLVAGSLLVGVGAGAVATLASTVASAASPSPSPSSSGGSATSPPSMPEHGTPAHETAELPVTGANATKAQAAAVKAVGGGTAGAVTSDFMKTGYEVTVTKSDGTTVEVHLDSAFNVMQGGPH